MFISPGLSLPAPCAAGCALYCLSPTLPMLAFHGWTSVRGRGSAASLAVMQRTAQKLHPILSFRQVDEFVEAEAEGLKAKAEEAKEELDRLADLQNLKAEVAFNSALAGGQPVCGSGAAAWWLSGLVLAP